MKIIPNQYFLNSLILSDLKQDRGYPKVKLISL